MLSDFNKEVSKSYGVLYDNFAGGKYGYKGVAMRRCVDQHEERQADDAELDEQSEIHGHLS